MKRRPHLREVSRELAQEHRHARAQAHVSSPTHVRAQVPAPSQAHAHTHAHAHAHAHGQAHGHALIPWQRIALYIAAAALLLTGGIWLAVHYSIGAGTGELPHPLEAWSLRLHGLAAFVGVFVIGVLAAGHVPHGWRLSRRRRWAGQRYTGSILCAVAALLMLTGYALFYFAPEAVRPALGWVHTGVGVTMGLLMVVHRRAVRGHPSSR